ncbi:hypothetical protein [Bacillus sp. FJAT-45350]|uniref:hypothetical protein n=1 Tax=Bacillus sp. FJAT-45350 TaxID=2011014 RepID=UPI00211C89F0|nr:hypothetical protein [Bacillus sp. FJAT-45350]
MENIIRLKYEERTFNSLEEMTEVLLHESNEQLIRIDIGQIENLNVERNYAKWRLMHIQRSHQDRTLSHKYRSTYNSLWSQLYRLEHQGEYRHPYLDDLIKLFMKDESND